jgi:hypothetical protein
VFPNDVPSRLPPVRGIEHQIDFVPGATIPNRPSYRSNPPPTTVHTTSHHRTAAAPPTPRRRSPISHLHYFLFYFLFFISFLSNPYSPFPPFFFLVKSNPWVPLHTRTASVLVAPSFAGGWIVVRSGFATLGFGSAHEVLNKKLEPVCTVITTR